MVDLGNDRYQVEYYAMVASVYSMSATVGSAGLHRDLGELNVQLGVISIAPRQSVQFDLYFFLALSLSISLNRYISMSSCFLSCVTSWAESGKCSRARQSLSRLSGGRSCGQRLLRLEAVLRADV